MNWGSHGFSVRYVTLLIFQTQRLIQEGSSNQQRSWFQDHEEREKARMSLKLGSEAAAAGLKKNQKKFKSRNQKKREMTV